jgi:hypothetical protein
MAINYTNLLGLAQPVTGTEANTWGDVVNDGITALVEEAVAGATVVDVTTGNVSLTSTNGVPNQARSAILVVTGTPSSTRNIVAPSKSKTYVVLNNSDSSVVLKGSATSGVTILSGSKETICWDGTDFVSVGAAGAVQGPGSSVNDNVALFSGTTGKVIKDSGKALPAGTVVGTSDSQTLTNKIIDGSNNTLSNVNLATQVTGTLPVANGGTGATTLTGVLIGNGTSAFSTKTNPTGDFVGTTQTQTLTNKTITNVVFDGRYTEDVFGITDSGSVDLNPANGTIQTWTLGGSRSPTAFDFGDGQSMVLMIDDGTDYTITWPSVQWRNNGGNAPTLGPTGYTVIVLWKVSSVLYGLLAGNGS